MKEKPSLRKARFALALALSLVPRALLAHVAPMDAREMIAASPDVVVAVVEGRESRWNPQHTLILTDYSLRVEDRLRGQAPDRLTLSIPGGTLDGVTDETCLTVRLETGARYLLFLDDVGQSALSPITAAAGGMYREVPDPSGSRVAAGEGRTPLVLKGQAVRFADFVAAVRGLVAEVEAVPAPAASSAPRAKSALPAKTYDPSLVRLVRKDAAYIPSKATGAGGAQGIHQAFVFFELAQVPILVNPLLGDSAFSPVDQELMAYWNLYGGDVFAVSPATSTWAWGNGVFDLAGFPDDAQMTTQFQRSWGGLGSGVLGVTFSRRRDGVITEADIALNPHFDWTTNDLEATRRNATYSFREAMVHELGHSWGLKHPWETQEVDWDSVMNYKSKLYHVHTLTADDATAVRAAHPGVSIHDGLISSYTTAYDPFGSFPQYVPSRPSPSSVRRGSSFNLINPIKVENPGTEPISNFTVEVFLAPQRFSFDHAIRVKTIRVRGTLRSSAVQKIAVGKVVVPRNVPPGTYFLAFRLVDAKDVYPSNNGAWSSDEVRLTVTK